MTVNSSPNSPRPRSLPDPLWRHVLGSHLRELRHGRGERLVETAERAGISPQYLSEIERGLKEPSSEMIDAVAGALQTSLGDLVLGVADTLRPSTSTSTSTSTRTTAARVFALAA
jgi:transcriptional regulator with XRE-family HTH domain